MKILSVETARPDCSESFQWQSQSYDSHSWREHIEIQDGNAVARFANGTPAIVEKGNVTYIATLTDDAFLKDFLRVQCEKLSVAVVDMDDDIRMSYRGGLGFAFNYSGESKAAPVPEGAKVVLGDVLMPPQGVVAWEV